ncbi:MAG: hypothetical protein JO297_08330 [Nitrososphaeraceae archaeon]|nr:hypothetical protein [Nitrososphaeraceae archaeon]
MLTSLLPITIIIILSIYVFHPSLVVAYRETKDMDKSVSNHDNIVPIADNNNNIFSNLAKQFEYTLDLDGKQIFPNDTIKQDIVSKYKSADYNIDNLNYKLLGFNITASNIKIHVNPSRIDQTTTRVDFPVMTARNVTVSNGSINSKYGEVNLGSIYGIYNKSTDKMTMHIPSSVALRYLLHF